MRLLKSISLFSSILPIKNYSIVRPQLKGNSTFKPVLLTFDDGPNQIDSVTMELLSVLKKHNAKVCFCLIGKNVKQYPHIVKQMYLDGHILGNHGHSGDVFIFKKKEKILMDIDACNVAICEAIENIGHKIDYFRPGYGAYFKTQKHHWESKSMRILPVTDFFFDHKVKPSEMEKFVLQFTKKVKKNNGGAYVLHDGRNEHHKINSKITTSRLQKKISDYDRTWVPVAVDKILIELKKSGFIIPALDDGLPNQLNSEFKKFLFGE